MFMMSLSLPYKEDVEQWSVEQVAAWLQQREMPEVADVYLRRGIDGHIMLNLPEASHVSLFTEFPIRKKADILNIINQIKNQPAISNRKMQPSRSSNQNNFATHKKWPNAIPSQQGLPLPPNNLRHVNSNSASSSFESNSDEEVECCDVPYIDDAPNEDYLVPLSTGMLGKQPQQPPPIKPKKEKCPSPIVSQGLRERNSIQDLELPKVPGTQKGGQNQAPGQQQQFHFNQVKKFPFASNADNHTGKGWSSDRPELQNKEDLNAYEIIHEGPTTDIDKRPHVETKESLAVKPPDLPNRNLIPPGNAAAPVVPPRTHASTQHIKKNPFNAHSHGQSAFVRPPPLSSQILEFSSTAHSNSLPINLPQPPSSHLRQPFTPNKKSTPLPNANHVSIPPTSSISVQKQNVRVPLQVPQTNLTFAGGIKNIPSAPSANYKLHSNPVIAASTDVGRTNIAPISQSTTDRKIETLNLGEGKSVPLSSLYKSLLDMQYFHPIVRNAVAKLLTEEGMYLVRPSTHSQHPLTLSFYSKGKVFNISIRSRNDGKYALGTEKVGEVSFFAVNEMIEYHKKEPIKLEDGSLSYLVWSPPKANTYVRH